MAHASVRPILDTRPATAEGDYELVAQQVSALNDAVAAVVKRLVEVEKVNARLEVAALTTARALGEISQHWSAVYEAMRRDEEDLLARSADPAAVGPPPGEPQASAGRD
jgi:hypothetical protein